MTELRSVSIEGAPALSCVLFWVLGAALQSKRIGRRNKSNHGQSLAAKNAGAAESRAALGTWRGRWVAISGEYRVHLEGDF